MTIPSEPEVVIDPTQSPEVSSDDRLWVVLCFLLTPLLPLITLFLEEKKNRSFIKYHTVPIMILGVAEAIFLIILSYIPVVRCLGPLVYIINILYAIKANRGIKIDIPLATEFAKKQNWS